ncbi:hypothetical protein B0H13DRAFT_2681636 [Mycena leptocephala]|nr:hypothetical protein B0H13DRAFT_2681636 [Mycena leptocephala]
MSRRPKVGGSIDFITSTRTTRSSDAQGATAADDTSVPCTVEKRKRSASGAQDRKAKKKRSGPSGSVESEMPPVSKSRGKSRKIDSDDDGAQDTQPPMEFQQVHGGKLSPSAAATEDLDKADGESDPEDMDQGDDEYEVDDGNTDLQGPGPAAPSTALALEQDWHIRDLAIDDDSSKIEQQLRIRLTQNGLDHAATYRWLDAHPPACLSGSLPLAAITSALWKPEDTDIYVRYEDEEAAKRFVTLSQNFFECKVAYQPSYQANPALEKILYFQRGKHALNVMVAREDVSPAVAVFRFHSTAVMNIVFPRVVISPYYSSIQMGVSWTNPTYRGTPEMLRRSKEKYTGRGYQFREKRNPAELQTHICKVDPDCLSTVRMLRDASVKKWRINRDLDNGQIDAGTEKIFAELNVRWRLGGPLCTNGDIRLEDIADTI